MTSNSSVKDRVRLFDKSSSEYGYGQDAKSPSPSRNRSLASSHALTTKFQSPEKRFPSQNRPFYEDTTPFSREYRTEANDPKAARSRVQNDERRDESCKTANHLANTSSGGILASKYVTAYEKRLLSGHETSSTAGQVPENYHDKDSGVKQSIAYSVRPAFMSTDHIIISPKGKSKTNSPSRGEEELGMPQLSNSSSKHQPSKYYSAYQRVMKDQQFQSRSLIHSQKSQTEHASTITEKRITLIQSTLASSSASGPETSKMLRKNVVDRIPSAAEKHTPYSSSNEKKSSNSHDPSTKSMTISVEESENASSRVSSTSGPSARTSRLMDLRSRSPSLYKAFNSELRRNLEAASVVMEEEKSSIGSGSSTRSSLSDEELGNIAKRALQLSKVSSTQPLVRVRVVKRRETSSNSDSEVPRSQPFLDDASLVAQPVPRSSPAQDFIKEEVHSWSRSQVVHVDPFQRKDKTIQQDSHNDTLHLDPGLAFGSTALRLSNRLSRSDKFAAYLKNRKPSTQSEPSGDLIQKGRDDHEKAATSNSNMHENSPNRSRPNEQKFISSPRGPKTQALVQQFEGRQDPDLSERKEKEQDLHDRAQQPDVSSLNIDSRISSRPELQSTAFLSPPAQPEPEISTGPPKVTTSTHELLPSVHSAHESERSGDSMCFTIRTWSDEKSLQVLKIPGQESLPSQSSTFSHRASPVAERSVAERSETSSGSERLPSDNLKKSPRSPSLSTDAGEREVRPPSRSSDPKLTPSPRASRKGMATHHEILVCAQETEAPVHHFQEKISPSKQDEQKNSVVKSDPPDNEEAMNPFSLSAEFTSKSFTSFDEHVFEPEPSSDLNSTLHGETIEDGSAMNYSSGSNNFKSSSNEDTARASTNFSSSSSSHFSKSSSSTRELLRLPIEGVSRLDPIPDEEPPRRATAEELLNRSSEENQLSSNLTFTESSSAPDRYLLTDPNHESRNESSSSSGHSINMALNRWGHGTRADTLRWWQRNYAQKAGGATNAVVRNAFTRSRSRRKTSKSAVIGTDRDDEDVFSGLEETLTPKTPQSRPSSFLEITESQEDANMENASAVPDLFQRQKSAFSAISLEEFATLPPPPPPPPQVRPGIVQSFANSLMTGGAKAKSKTPSSSHTDENDVDNNKKPRRITPRSARNKRLTPSRKRQKKQKLARKKNHNSESESNENGDDNLSDEKYETVELKSPRRRESKEQTPRSVEEIESLLDSFTAAETPLESQEQGSTPQLRKYVGSTRSRASTLLSDLIDTIEEETKVIDEVESNRSPKAESPEINKEAKISNKRDVAEIVKDDASDASEEEIEEDDADEEEDCDEVNTMDSDHIDHHNMPDDSPGAVLLQLGYAIVDSLTNACKMTEGIPHMPECGSNVDAYCSSTRRKPKSGAFPYEPADTTDPSSRKYDHIDAEKSASVLTENERERWKQWEEQDDLAAKEEETRPIGDGSTRNSSPMKRLATEQKRSEAQDALLVHAKKAKDRVPLTRAVLSIVSDGEVPSVCVDTPKTAGTLETALSMQQRGTLQRFSLMLRNQRVEILKLNRHGRWQTRYLTVSKETSWLRAEDGAGDVGACPQALIWLKGLHSRNSGVASLKDEGRGGFPFTRLKTIQRDPSKTPKIPIPRKLRSKFPEYVGVLIKYQYYDDSHGEGVREVMICMQSNADAKAFCAAMDIIRDVVRRDKVVSTTSGGSSISPIKRQTRTPRLKAIRGRFTPRTN